MNVKYFIKPLAAVVAAAVAVGGGGVQPLSTLLGTVASAAYYKTNTDGFSYINRRWDDTSKQVIREEVNYGGKYVTMSYLNSLPTGNISLLGLEWAAFDVDTNWYIASESLTIDKRMQVGGTVNLVICDGVTLTCNDGIHCPEGNELNIYFQSQETGKLIANADTDNNAAIGGDNEQSGGTIRIFGGSVTADAHDHGGDDAAGIGGGCSGNGGTVEIYGGTVIAKGANINEDGGAGIGGGDEGSGGTVRIYGGTVNATGGPDGAGIGGGDGGSGGTIEIYGGNITASSATDGAGIGGGDKGSGGNITIGGGTVNATGGSYAAGIGGGDVDATGADGGIIKITGGNVTAQGGRYGAGIGGGEAGGGGNITISGGTLTATGGEKSAGIGGGDNGSGGSITITGGTVTTTGASEAAGIGGGEERSGGTINISNGEVHATGGSHGAGIGGGYKATCGTVNISGGTVEAIGWNGGAGIGNGRENPDPDDQKITISGGDITARSEGDSKDIISDPAGGAGIGGSNGGLNEKLEITITNCDKIRANGGLGGGAGIGGGVGGRSGKITINGGADIKVQGGTGGGAGIGSGSKCEQQTGKTVDVTINGGKIHAISGFGNAYNSRVQSYYFYPGPAIGAGGVYIYSPSLSDPQEITYSYFNGDISLNGGTVHLETKGLGGGYTGGDNNFTLIGATSGTSLKGVTGKVYFRGATVDMATLTDISDPVSYDVYQPDSVRASDIIFEECQRVDYTTGSIGPSENAVAVADESKSNSRKKIFSNPRVYSVKVSPCIEHKCIYTVTDTKHSGVCEYCGKSTDEDHLYDEPVWTWSGDHSSATAEFKCICGHEESVQATVTREQNDDLITYTAAAEFKGKSYTTEYKVTPCSEHKYTYTSTDTKHKGVCEVCGNSVEEDHIYDEPVWTWSGDHSSATAAFKCICGHEASAQATVTREQNGDLITYTAAAEIAGKTFTGKYEEYLEYVTGNPIQYQIASFDETTGKVTERPADISDYFRLHDTTNSWIEGTYALKSDVTVKDKITVSGNVDLILCDGVQLTAENGIVVGDGGHLNIYAQENGTGRLVARGANGGEGEGGSDGIEGNVTIHGGTIDTKGGNGGNGGHSVLGGLAFSDDINDVKGGNGGNGIEGNILIYGGTLGISGGNGGNGGAAITLNDISAGDINAGDGGNGGSGIEGNILIYGGTLDISGGNGGDCMDLTEYQNHGRDGNKGENGAAISATRAELSGTPTFTNGDPFTRVPEKAATYTENGNIDYYAATNGASYSKEGNVYTPISLDEVIIPMLEPVAEVTAGSLDKVRTFSSSTGSKPVTAAVLTVNVENVSTKIAVTYGGKTISTNTSIMGDVAIGVIVEAKDDLKLGDFSVKAFVE